MKKVWEFLLGTDLPDDAQMKWGELVLRGSFPVILATLLALAGMGLAVFFYWKETGKHTFLDIVRRLGLAALRTFAIWLVLFLLLRPSLVAEFHGERKRGVVMMNDNSQSLQQQDRRLTDADRMRVALALNRVDPKTSVNDPAPLAQVGSTLPRDPTRLEMLHALLQHPSLDLPLENHDGRPVRHYLFAGQVRGLGEQTSGNDQGKMADRLVKAIQASEPKTALADAILEILQRTDNDLPSAIVLFTDGRDNSSKKALDEAARECGRLGVPLHLVGLGSTEGGLLQIRDVAAPENIFSDDTVSVPIRWRAQGIKAGRVVLTMTLDGKTVATKEVDVKEGDDLREVLSFKPPKATSSETKQELAVTIRAKDNELLKDSVTRQVRLIDRKIKVLVIENSPRWEFKFLMQFLLRDEKRIDIRILLAEGDPDALKSGYPYIPTFPETAKDLFAYDLVILGDVPASFLGPKHIDMLKQFVSEGHGLVSIAGRQHNPASYKGTPLEPLFPVEFVPVSFKMDDTKRPEPFVPMQTPLGQRTDMLSLADTPEENEKIWKDLPGIYWHYPVTDLRPGGISLLDHPKAMTGRDRKIPMPLIASQIYGKGTVLFLGIDETWRWRFNEQDRFFGRFWGQVIYQSGFPQTLGNKRVQVMMDQGDHELNRPAHVYARVLDKDFLPAKDLRIPATLERLDAKPGEPRSTPITLEAIAGQPGEYRYSLPNDKVGKFAIKFDQPEPTTMEYRVALPPQHEMEPAGLNIDALKDAAELSGGKFYREENLHELRGAIESKTQPNVERQEIVLWNPLMFILFGLIISCEWLLRKMSNMS